MVYLRPKKRIRLNNTIRKIYSMRERCCTAATTACFSSFYILSKSAFTSLQFEHKQLHVKTRAFMQYSSLSLMSWWVWYCASIIYVYCILLRFLLACIRVCLRAWECKCFGGSKTVHSRVIILTYALCVCECVCLCAYGNEQSASLHSPPLFNVLLY